MAEPVEFRCPHCGQLYRLDASQLARRSGQTTTCRRCQQPFTFPTIEAPPAEEQPPEESAATQEPTAEEPTAQGPAAQVPPSELPPPSPPPEAAPPSEPIPTVSYHRAAPRRPTPGFGDFLAFRTMITPAVIQILFWAGVIITVILGLTIILAALAVPSTTNPWFLATGLAYIVLGPIVVRVYCELLIVIFRIHDTLNDIKTIAQEKRG